MSYQCHISKCETSVHRIRWDIEKFSCVVKTDDLMKSQTLNFQTEGPEPFGLLKWKLYLTKTDSKVKAHLRLRSSAAAKKDDFSEKFAQLGMTWGYQASEILMRGKDEERELCGTPWNRKSLEAGITWDNYLDVDSHQQYLDQNGTLVLTLAIHLSVMREPVQPTRNLSSSLDKFYVRSVAISNKALLTAVQRSRIPFTEVTMISMDRQEVRANWAVLAARSPVFASMYDSKMKERTTGVIELKNISGKTLSVFYNFICTGKLIPAWRDNDVIVELVHMASLYQLLDLLAFFDEVLDLVCSEATVMKLFDLCQNLFLWKASEGLLGWIRKYGVNSPELFMNLLVLAQDDDNN